MKTLEERQKIVDNYRLQGFNCSQSVLAAFTDVTGLSEDDTFKVALGLGGGLGGLHSVCGCVSALSCVVGYRLPPNPGFKQEAYAKVQKLAKRFEKEFGSMICQELKGNDSEQVGTSQHTKHNCNVYIHGAVRLLHEALERGEM